MSHPDRRQQAAQIVRLAAAVEEGLAIEDPTVEQVARLAGDAFTLQNLAEEIGNEALRVWNGC